MLEATFRPLTKWPAAVTPADARRSLYSFKAPWESTLDLLERELRQIGARDVIVQVDLPPSAIRNDGWPRGDVTPATPGVVLSFTHPEHGTLVYSCDACELWKHNLRSIGLTLEALRAVDRYGAVTAGQQYAGFKALPGAGQTTTALTTQSAAELLATWGQRPVIEILGRSEVAREAARLAMARSHPDKNGNGHIFALVGEAKRILGAHHGVVL